jgi:hypothetical protein
MSLTSYQAAPPRALIMATWVTKSNRNRFDEWFGRLKTGSSGRIRRFLPLYLLRFKRSLPGYQANSRTTRADLFTAGLLAIFAGTAVVRCKNALISEVNQTP